MPISEWSESILIAEVSDEPTFSEEMDALFRRLDEMGGSMPDVIVDASAVSYLNSSNISQLLKTRRQVGVTVATLSETPDAFGRQTLARKTPSVPHRKQSHSSTPS